MFCGTCQWPFGPGKKQKPRRHDLKRSQSGLSVERVFGCLLGPAFWLDMSLCLEASDVCTVNKGDCGWVWEWKAGHFGMCSSWPGTWPGGLCLLLESLWTRVLESLRTRVLPISLGKLRPKVLSNAEFSAAKLERRLFNSADGVIVWDVESDLQLFLFICGCGPF